MAAPSYTPWRVVGDAPIPLTPGGRYDALVIPMSEWDWGHWLGFFWVGIVTPASIIYAFFIHKVKRRTPAGYIGKYRRPDGLVVHVSRFPGGQLYAMTDEAPGVQPRDLGYVDGREITRWTKLSATPDGPSVEHGVSGAG
jgi:hypothetical protein